MIAEVVSVGTELLIGEIQNGNAAFLGRRLADAGLDAHLQVTVGDNMVRIVDVLRTACTRADVVIVTGGIGPTRDDLTKEALCEVASVQMVRIREHAERIRAHVIERRGAMHDSVLRMADVPRGGEALPNENGLAVGVALENAGTSIFVLPGVPREMEPMFDQHVMPRLTAITAGETLRSAVVRTRGLGESEVAHRLDPLFASTNPSIAFRISDTEVHVRVTAKASTAESAERMVADMSARVRAVVGDAGV